jgi:hypothetical protein
MTSLIELNFDGIPKKYGKGTMLFRLSWKGRRYFTGF